MLNEIAPRPWCIARQAGGGASPDEEVAMLESSQEGERQETLQELSDLFVVVQEMGRRLADETHGDAYAAVREFNETLHQACVQLKRIRQDSGMVS